MGIHAAKAAGLREAYDNLQSQISKLQQDRKEETDLIAFVNQLIAQCSDIDQKMTDAITAMTELSLLFSNQSDCYDKIAVSLDRMKTSTDLGALKSRKQFIQYQMKVCIDKLKEVGQCFSFHTLLINRFNLAMLTPCLLSVESCGRGVYQKYSYPSQTLMALPISELICVDLRRHLQGDRKHDQFLSAAR